MGTKRKYKTLSGAGKTKFDTTRRRDYKVNPEAYRKMQVHLDKLGYTGKAKEYALKAYVRDIKRGKLISVM